jgi:hypothetical protein
MITGFPSVSRLKYFRSDGNRQGISLSDPIMPFRATAAIKTSSGKAISESGFQFLKRLLAWKREPGKIADIFLARLSDKRPLARP